MHILHVIQRYWPAIGGAENYLAEISERLAADGHRVTVATTDALDLELFWDRARQRVPEHTAVSHAGVHILRFPVRHLPFARLAYPGLRRLLWWLSQTRIVPVPVLSCLAHFTPWVPGLERWLQTTDARVDLVAGMTICFEPLLADGLRFARRRGIPFVIYPLTHLGAGPEPGTDPVSRFYTMRHQVAIVGASDALVAMTPTEARFYSKQGVPAANAVVAGAGITPAKVLGGDSARFRQRHGIDAPLVVSLSTMSYDKGTVHLVEAVRRLWREGRQVELALAGALLEPFQRYLDRLPQEDRQRLRVLGSIDEQEKRDLFAAADIFAMASRTDSFGITYLEAWLYRKPVIAARTWGITDVVADGQDGLLVPFGDVPALADALVKLLEDPARRAALGLHGEEKVHQFHTWERKYALVRDLYLQLVERRR